MPVKPSRPRLKGFAPPTEKEEQRAVITLFRTIGATVYPMSQYRASHVAVGIPDMWVMHEKRKLGWWFETKRYEGMWTNYNVHASTNAFSVAYDPHDRETWRPRLLSDPQVRFMLSCRACGIRHFWGGLQEAEQALIEMGLAERTGNGGIVLTPVKVFA